MSTETRVVNLATSGAVLTGAGVIEGFYVNSTSSGTLRLWHGTTFADIGQPINGGVKTPAVGWHYLGGLQTTAVVYAQMTNTLNVDFHIKQGN